MRVTTVEIHNFRLLKDVELVLDERATVVVGRNNSGKTSLTELFRRLLGEASPKFHLEDFSLSALEAFWQAFVLYQEGKEEPEVRAALPTIRMKLTVSYDPAVTDLGTLSEFIIDLDPDSTVTNVEARYELSDGMLSALFEGDHFPPESTAEQKKLLLLKILKERVPKHYGGVLRAIDPNDDTN